MLTLTLVPVFGLGLLAWGVTSYVRLGSDARALRNCLKTACGCHTKFEANLGSVTFAAARGVIQFVDLQPEVRAAVRFVRHAEVGVYRLDATPNPEERLAVVLGSQSIMSKHGWEPCATVSRKTETVMVFTPKASGGDDIEVCLCVIHDRDMVIVSGRGHLPAIIELLEKFKPWQKAHSLSL